jgi:hypothetical protein
VNDEIGGICKEGAVAWFEVQCTFAWRDGEKLRKSSVRKEIRAGRLLNTNQKETLLLHSTFSIHTHLISLNVTTELSVPLSGVGPHSNTSWRYPFILAALQFLLPTVICTPSPFKSTLL